MSSENHEECVLCCREIRIYAIGRCDHPVCYECSARMRVLCETNECPICRSDMPLVVFTHQSNEFSRVYRRFTLLNRKYQILYEDDTARRAFNLLLINRCQICEEEYPTFEKLREHVRRKHELFYCDLCTESLKIFTFERKCYNRKDLARHKVKGDPDQTSHRGHPLCEFCDMRYVDHDDLFRHLRREHYFCHFCDADGLHQYYGNYDYLKAHFRSHHYLCEEGDCANERFTAAFRSDIDLKAHKATQHGKYKSKAEARQARTLELEFNYRPPTRPLGSPRGKRYVQSRRNNGEEQAVNERPVSKSPPQPEPINTQSTQEFPYLSDDPVSNSTSVAKPPMETLSLQTFGRTSAPSSIRHGNMSAEDFPALGSAAVSELAVSQNRKIDFSLSAQSSKKTHSNRFNASDDPKQESKPFKEAPATPKWISVKDKTSFEDAFPKLEKKKITKVTIPVEEPKNTTLLNVASSAPVSSNNNYAYADSLEAEDQFVIIKNKSKKKKQKKHILQENDEEGEIPEKSNVSDPLLSLNSFSILNNQENKDPIIRNPVMQPSRNYREPDPWETKVSFGKDDFPPLEGPKKPPPGLNIRKAHPPPPGFSTNSNTLSSNSPLSMSSIARIVENSVKNNSNIVIDKNGGAHSFYQEPPDFQLRNEKLLNLIKLESRTSENFDKFKTVSRNFRCDSITASEYQSKCLDILGKDGYQKIFPELVSLLPDIPKQQELLTVHNIYLDELYSKAKRKNFKVKTNILSCKSCNQVLLSDDCGEHRCVS